MLGTAHVPRVRKSPFFGSLVSTVCTTRRHDQFSENSSSFLLLECLNTYKARDAELMNSWLLLSSRSHGRLAAVVRVVKEFFISRWFAKPSCHCPGSLSKVFLCEGSHPVVQCVCARLLIGLEWGSKVLS